MNKVLHVMPHAPGRSNRLALQISYAIDEFDIETLVVCDSPPSNGADDASAHGQVTYLPDRFQNPSKGRVRQVVESAMKAIWMTRYLLKSRPDIIHVHEHLLIWVALIGMLLNKPVVWDPHDYFYEGFESGPLRWAFIKRCMERVLVWRGVPCLMVSQGMREIYQQMYPGITKYLIRNFSLMRPDFTLRNPALPRDAGVLQSGSVVRVIYPGQILKDRLPMDFIKAVARDDGLLLDIYGMDRWGTYPEAIRAEIHAESTQNIRLMGSYSPSDLPAILANYDYAVFPYVITSRNIDFCLPNKFFQCLAAGLPIIVSNLRELGAIVTEHGLGHVFQAGNYQQAVALMQAWPPDSSEYVALKQRVREYALTQIDYQAEARVLLGVYAALLAPGEQGLRADARQSERR